MSNKLIFLAIGILSGIAISVWYLGTNDTRPTDTPALDVRAESVETRLAALESTMARQIEAVRDEIESLRTDLVLLSVPRDEELMPSFQPANGAAVGNPTAVGDRVSEVDRLRRIVAFPDGRIGALIEAGFTRVRAEQIDRLLEENRVAAMQARYEAARRGESPPQGNAEIEELFDEDSMLRSELGDADYERYLAAMGRPTEVLVIDVLTSSAAEQAGMVEGDRIVAYDGQRVFDIRELLELPIQGEPGAPVMVDILRDGQPMQLVLPRGPLGISAPLGSPVPVPAAEPQ